MSRPAKIIREIEQLQEVTDGPLDLCITCKGCDLRKQMDSLRHQAWKEHRQGVTFLVHRCNTYRVVNDSI